MASPLSLATPVRYQQQPQASVQVDWSHPLARGLVFFQIPSQQAARDLVGGSAPTILGATTVTGGPGGRAMLSSTTASTGWATPYRSDRLRTMTTEFTVACHVDIQAITANSKLVCLPLFQPSWTAPYQSFSLGRGSSTSQMTLTMAPGAGNGTGTPNAQFPATTFAVADGAKYVATRSGTTTALLHNGTLYAPASSSITAVPVQFDTGSQVALMNRNSAAQGEGTQGRMYYAAIWNRALSEAEARSFQANPYQILKPATRLALFSLDLGNGSFSLAGTAALPKFRSTAAATVTSQTTAFSLAGAAALPKFRSTVAAAVTTPVPTSGDFTSEFTDEFANGGTAAGGDFTSEFTSEFQSGSTTSGTTVVGFAAIDLPRFGTRVSAVMTSAAALSFGFDSVSVSFDADTFTFDDTDTLPPAPPAVAAVVQATLPRFGIRADGSAALPGTAGRGTGALRAFSATAAATRSIPARLATATAGLPRLRATTAAIRTIPPITAASVLALPGFGGSGEALRDSDDRSATVSGALPRLSSAGRAVRDQIPVAGVSEAALPRFTTRATAARSATPRFAVLSAGLLRLRSSAEVAVLPPAGTVIPVTVGHKRAPSWRLADAGTGQTRLSFASPLDPNSLTYFTIDWSQELSGSADTIWLDKTSIGVEPDPAAEVAGLMLRSITFDATSVTIWLRIADEQQTAAYWSGDGETHRLNFTIKTLNGQTLNRDVSVTVKQL